MMLLLDTTPWSMRFDNLGFRDYPVQITEELPQSIKFSSALLPLYNSAEENLPSNAKKKISSFETEYSLDPIGNGRHVLDQKRFPTPE